MTQTTNALNIVITAMYLRLRHIMGDEESGVYEFDTGELIPSLEAEAFEDGKLGGGGDNVEMPVDNPKFAYYLNRNINLRVVDLETRLDELEKECMHWQREVRSAKRNSAKQRYFWRRLQVSCRKAEDAMRDIEATCRMDDRIYGIGTADAELTIKESDMTHASELSNMIDILRNHAELAKSGEYRSCLIGNVNKSGNYRGMTPANKQHEDERIERAIQWYNSMFLFAENNLSKNKRAKGTDMVHEYATEQLLRIAYATAQILNYLATGTYWTNEKRRYSKQLSAYLEVKEANQSISPVLKSLQIHTNGSEEDAMNWLDEQPVNHAQERCWLNEDEIISHLDAVPRPWLYDEDKDINHTL